MVKTGNDEQERKKRGMQVRLKLVSNNQYALVCPVLVLGHGSLKIS